MQTVTNDAVLLWARRAINDFDKKVGKNSSTKQKAREKKLNVFKCPWTPKPKK